MTPTSPPPPKIEMQNVAKAFGDNQVLCDVSLSVAAEESLAIIGTSGCGKSVTLKCLLGLLRADSGSIRVDGQELIHATRADLESVRRRWALDEFHQLGQFHQIARYFLQWLYFAKKNKWLLLGANQPQVLVLLCRR